MSTSSSDDSIPDGIEPESPGDEAAQVARQEYEIDVIRDHLGVLFHELNVRRHDWLPLRLIRRIPGPLLLVGLGALGLGAGAGVWKWRARTARERNSWLNQAKQLGLAARRAIDAPEAVARTSPNVPKKLLTAAAVAAVGVLTRRLLRSLADDRR